MPFWAWAVWVVRLALALAGGSKLLPGRLVTS